VEGVSLKDTPQGGDHVARKEKRNENEEKTTRVEKLGTESVW